MSKINKHFKWPGFKAAYTDWWTSLSIEQKVSEKNLFELKRLANLKIKNPYPDMKDLTGLRLSQLSDRHICRIHDFKDRNVESFK